VRKATLRCMLAKAGLSLRFNEHLEGDGPSSPMPARWDWRALSASAMTPLYRSGRSPDCVKMKNPVCKAATRESEGDWS